MYTLNNEVHSVHLEWSSLTILNWPLINMQSFGKMIFFNNVKEMYQKPLILRATRHILIISFLWLFSFIICGDTYHMSTTYELFIEVFLWSREYKHVWQAQGALALVSPHDWLRLWGQAIIGWPHWRCSRCWLIRRRFSCFSAFSAKSAMPTSPSCLSMEFWRKRAAWMLSATGSKRLVCACENIFACSWLSCDWIFWGVFIFVSINTPKLYYVTFF